MKAIYQLIAYLLSAAFAYFFPEMAGETDLPDWFITFGAFAPLAMFLAAKVNTWQQWQGIKAWLVTFGVGTLLAGVGYLLDFGIFAEAVIWHLPVYGLGVAVAAIGIFTIEQVKVWLTFIFNYEWKKK